MSKKSASEFVKKHFPNNASGSVPQALDMIKQLKSIDGMINPKMPSAVGAGNLVAMLKHIQKLFNPPEKKKQIEDELKKNPNAQRKTELLAQLAEIQKEIDDINKLEQDIKAGKF